MCGARIQEGHQALTVDRHRQEHSPLVSNARESMEEDHESRRESGRRWGLRRNWGSQVAEPVSGDVLLDVVDASK